MHTVSPVTTPCIGVCQLDAEGFCFGCDRHRGEIAAWGGMSEAQRQQWMREVAPLRRAQRSGEPPSAL